MRYSYLLSSLLLVAATTHAGVIINGTRMVYQGNKQESSIGVSNPDNINYLVQSWVDAGTGKKASVPFLITPPLFRLDAKEDNVLRVVRTGGTLPEDRESLYWLNIKAIPSSHHSDDTNTLQIAINTRIKLLYRPESVKGKPEDVAEKLQWHREGNDLVVNNPTPFYMNFQAVTLNGHKVTSATWAVPDTETHFALQANTSGTSVSWSVITDYGSISKTWSATLH
ncbi:molecular chaperone [Scandinavium sp. NPDC088450]|uniref:fimbrial biogenesis chaperone n=1 Tax=Scandinavium sp. NPDC088450 TaxID=3364514 RepID=UPI00384B0720